METPAAEPGRRELNKRRTRQALERAAARLFEERGYEATTVRDIADVAGVGERTFFRYFRSKESLILQQAQNLVLLVGDELRSRPATEPPLVALRNAILELAARRGSAPAILFTGVQPPGPAGRGERFLLFDLEEVLAAAFLDRLAAAGSDPADRESLLRASVLARAGVGVLRAVRLAFSRLPEAERDSTEVVDLVRKGFAVLER
ncbi:TetR family transcriptional regulator [Streptomyces globisporus]|uniref:TetR family transcriptional regulator n=1 Tax=Streptomyces globisporus TaxID=1908 RepID=UPI00131ACB13|nr:TetR/AcrR family transcriptional regulator [Streptomyces globisporus]